MSAVMTYQIRPVASEERESVQRMWAAAGMAQAAPDEWDALLTNETSAVLVAEDDGRVIASAVADLMAGGPTSTTSRWSRSGGRKDWRTPFSRRLSDICSALVPDTSLSPFMKRTPKASHWLDRRAICLMGS